jgi:uncharacterized protein
VRLGRCLIAVALALVPRVAASTDLEVPFLSGRVNDTAGLVDAATRQRLEERLAEFESEGGVQVAVLTIPSLEGEVLEEFSIRVAETWSLGREGVDDGVLVLVARDDRKMRIEVGYGLEDRLTDLTAGRILDDVMKPRFRAGNFSGGIEAGVGAILDTLQGIEVEALTAKSKPQRLPWKGRLIGLAIFSINVGLFSLVAIFSSGGGSWFLYIFLMPFYFLFPSALIHSRAGPIMLLLWVVGFPILKALKKSALGRGIADRHPKLKKAFSKGGGWHWTSGGGGGGGFSSGGGFSGGGGSFGGGGSSGSW